MAPFASTLSELCAGLPAVLPAAANRGRCPDIAHAPHRNHNLTKAEKEVTA